MPSADFILLRVPTEKSEARRFPSKHVPSEVPKVGDTLVTDGREWTVSDVDATSDRETLVTLRFDTGW